MAGSNDIRRIIRQSFDVVTAPIDQIDQTLRESYDDNYLVHDPSEERDIRSVDEFSEFVTMYRTAFPDLKIVLDGDIIVQGDTAATRYTITGTNTGELQGLPPTNKRVKVQGMEISTVRAGKVVETWQIFDTLGMFQQLGVVPKSEQLAQAR